MSDHYLTLKVSRVATQEQIKKAYRNLALKNHPDRGGSELAMKKLNEAYEILSDPLLRKEYDKQLTQNRNRGRHNKTKETEPNSIPKVEITNFTVTPTEISNNDIITISWVVLNSQSVNITLLGDVGASGTKQIKIKKLKKDLRIIINAMGENSHVNQEILLVRKSSNIVEIGCGLIFLLALLVFLIMGFVFLIDNELYGGIPVYIILVIMGFKFLTKSSEQNT